MAVTLVNTFNVTDDATLALQLVSSVTPVTIGSTTYVYTTGFGEDTVSVFTLAADGTLTSVAGGTVTDAGALELDGPTDATTAVLNGIVHLFVAGGSDDGISVFTVNSLTGTLVNVENETDNAGVLLANVVTLTVTQIDGSTVLIAGSFDENGVESFTVNPTTGVLTPVSSVLDNNFLLNATVGNSVPPPSAAGPSCSRPAFSTSASACSQSTRPAV